MRYHDTETTFTVEGLNDIRTYYFTVTGQSAIMESSPSNEAIVDMDTSVGENTGLQSVSIYPNPTSGMVSIEGANLNQVSVFNLLGEEVRRMAAQGEHTTLDLSDLPDGIYVVKASAETGSQSFRIVKIK